MSDKKELNIEQLEKVTGGDQCSSTIEGITYIHNIGDRVEVQINHKYYMATITKQGRLLFGPYYWAYVYLEFDNNEHVAIWVADEKKDLDFAPLADCYVSQLVIVAE